MLTDVILISAKLLTELTTVRDRLKNKFGFWGEHGANLGRIIRTSGRILLSKERTNSLLNIRPLKIEPKYGSNIGRIWDDFGTIWDECLHFIPTVPISSLLASSRSD